MNGFSDKEQTKPTNTTITEATSMFDLMHVDVGLGVQFET